MAGIIPSFELFAASSPLMFAWWLIGVKVLEPFGQQLRPKATSRQQSFRSYSLLYPKVSH